MFRICFIDDDYPKVPIPMYIGIPVRLHSKMLFDAWPLKMFGGLRENPQGQIPLRRLN